MQTALAAAAALLVLAPFSPTAAAEAPVSSAAPAAAAQAADPALAQPTATGTASFLARGNVGMKIEGRSTALSVFVTGSELRFALPLASLSTGIDIRDRHMQEDLQSDKFPSVELSVPRAGLQFPAAGAEVSGDAPGTLTLHGQSKPVTVHYTAKDSSGVDVTGKARLLLSDHGVEVRKYLGVTVKPEVDVEVSFHLAPGAAAR